MNLQTTIQDGQGRQITLGDDVGALIAEHNGIEIGRFDFDILENNHKCYDLLTNCNIDPAYQRSGIGTEMMRLAEDCYGDFCIVDHLSIEGAALINYCRQQVFQKGHKLIKDDRY